MGLLPTSTILTNEIKLYDFKGTKASLTFGDADINDGYSYLRMNFRANDLKFDFWQDKPIINFIADEEIMFNDKKIWHENNDGPMSGLNADMLDGLHASEFKDRNGHHHFGHAFLPGGSKMFVKVATFTPRRVGKAPDFNTQGSAPYQGIFAENIVKRMEASAKFEAFAEDTPENLATTGIGAFEHTDMASEGVYNATLRASISILRKGSTKEPPWNGPETIDVHVGLFEDPTNENTDGWACTSKYFYVSSHDRNVPFIKEHDDPGHNYLIGSNVVPMSEATLSSRIGNVATMEETGAMSRLAQVTQPSYSHEATDHSRPKVTGAGYVTPPDPTKNDYKAQKFPKVIPPGFGYQKDLEAFRLYHVDSHVDTIDGVKIVTHRFDLYMAVDTKTELHVQPYMSSSCLFYNYQKPISEANLPKTNFLMPKSIYDNRYSHVEHRHRNYEQKIENMDEEIEDIWQAFDNYVPIKQGVGNANKILMTNQSGSIVCEIDNLERHKDENRYKCRVMVSDKSGCIVESTITTTSLAQLEGIRENIQQQLDDMGDEIDDVRNKLKDYVLTKQGIENANKVLMTNSMGNVYCAVDNIEKHKDSSRYKLRVIVSDINGCLIESTITTTELDQLDGIRSNIQKQIDNIDRGDDIDNIFKMFKDYVLIKQGIGNANKVLMTDATGNVYCAIDNIEKHKDLNRYKLRVMVSDINGCIVESTITTTELEQLDGIRSNIQKQLDDMELHKHLNYETDISNLFKMFGDYVLIKQGAANANKVLMTDSTGKVYCAVDNIEKHKDTNRYKFRVIVSDGNGCLVESTITTTELNQLSGIRSNIQKQIDDLLSSISNLTIPNGDDYVKKTGDVMTGTLKMTTGATVQVEGFDSSIQTKMSVTTKSGYSGLYDAYEEKAICGLDNTKTSTEERIFFVQKKSFKVGGKDGTKVTIGASAPASPSVGDIWIKNT